VLFPAKLAQIQQHLAYVRRMYTQRRTSAYANLSKRLELQLIELDVLEAEVATLLDDFDRYQHAVNPAVDTLPQLIARLRDVSAQVQGHRMIYLPAYLANEPDEPLFASLFESLHREIGLADVYPVVCLQQPHFFAISATPFRYPLFFAPASVRVDPLELPLIFHEIGHLMYQSWVPDFPSCIDQALNVIAQRKYQEVVATSDPQLRQDKMTVLQGWVPLFARQVEELICDVVGALLGGPAFAIAHSLGLSMTDVNLFDYSNARYPPLDCRMRVNSIILQQRGFGGALLAEVQNTWDAVRSLPGTIAPTRFYDWLYDDALIGDMIVAVQAFLTLRGVNLYERNSGGLRERFIEGAVTRVAGIEEHRRWSEAFIASIESNYSSSLSSQPPSASSSSSNSSA